MTANIQIYKHVFMSFFFDKGFEEVHTKQTKHTCSMKILSVATIITRPYWSFVPNRPNVVRTRIIK